MKIKPGTIVAIIILILLVVGANILIRSERDKSRTKLAERIVADGPSPQLLKDISEIKKNIATYEGRLKQYIDTVSRTAGYWKLLAVCLQDADMHGEALDALERAIYYTPMDASLHYHTGVSAGIMAKSVHIFPGRDSSERQGYNNLAEDAFLRAIEIDSTYRRPHYSLGVLYVFDLDRPEDAIPYLERFLEMSRNDLDGMIVLARAYYMLRNYRMALELYDRVLTFPLDENRKREIQNNRQLVLGQMYG